MGPYRRKPQHDEPRLCPLLPRDERWLKVAAKAASMSDCRRRVGCVLVRGNRVLAVGVNSPRNAPDCCGARLWDASEHAEAAALRRCADPAGAVAYVVRLGADGTWRHAQPCRRCRARLERVGVRSVWSDDPAFVAAVAAA